MTKIDALRTSLPLLLLASALTIAGCSKKAEKAPEPTPVAEGSAKPAEGAKPVEGEPAKAEPIVAGGGSAVAEPAAKVDAKNLFDTVKSNEKLTTLTKAIEAAGLSTKLAEPGPFTILAPSDEAFAKVPAKDLEALLADKPKLEALLQYHVIPSAALSKDIGTLKTIKTVQGGELAIDGTKIAGASVITPDITASNGVVHVIDTVLLPPTK